MNRASHEKMGVAKAPATAGPPPCVVEDVAQSLQARGYAFFSGALPMELMGVLQRGLDQARSREEAEFGIDFLERIGQRGYVSDLMALGPPLESLLDHEVIWGLLDSLFAGDVRLYVGQGIVLDPGMERGVWPRCWHADMFEQRMALYDPTFCFGANCLVFVDDVTQENGPTCVLPGSHCLRELRTDERDLSEVEAQITGPAGSVLVMDGGLWHSAGTNRSAAPRRVLKLLFTRRWIRPQVDYLGTAPRGVAERLSPRVRFLLDAGPCGRASPCISRDTNARTERESGNE